MKHFRLKYIAISALAVVFTFILHELAHWLVGTVLGNKMGMTFNAAFVLAEGFKEIWHAFPVSAAGPVITLVQAVFIWVLMERKQNMLFYPFLMTPFVMRVLASVMNVIQPNDEGKISEYIGLGIFTLPVIVSGILFILVYRISKVNQFTRRFNFTTVVLIIIFSSVLIISDQFFNLRII